MLRFNFTHCGIASGVLLGAQSQYQGVVDRFHAGADSMMGWKNLPKDEALARQCRDLNSELVDVADHLLVLGIGGSSNGLKAMAQGIFGEMPPKLIVQESPDVEALQRKLRTAKADPNGTLVNVISKSGGTVETLALFEEAKKWLGPQWPRRVVVTTEENDGRLFQEVRRHSLPHLPVPLDVGGRFSALSAVGLFPLVFLEANIEAVLLGAGKALNNLEAIFQAALVHFLQLRDHGKTIAIQMGYGDGFKSFTEWWVQLWAESLGKEGKGQTPIASLGPQDQHSTAQLTLDGPRDKMVTFLTTRRDPYDLMRREQEATAKAFADSGIPNYTVELDQLDAENLGDLIMTYQIMVTLVGWMLEVNPFDQPGVQKIKQWLHHL